MKRLFFLNFLRPKEKLIFIIGSFIQKVGVKLDYPRLRKKRDTLLAATSMGYKCENQENTIQLVKDGVPILLRKEGSDFDVFSQVMVRDEYRPLISYIQDNNIHIKSIIDAGSNIGLTTVKLLSNFPQASAICIEPDSENYQLLAKNLQPFGKKNQILLNALWYDDCELYLDLNFRDGKHWSRGVSKNNSDSNKPVKGISMKTLISTYKIEKIDVLKIDIEGSEASIFKNENDLSFLDITKILIIEIHDEYNCREIIYEILQKRGYLLFNSEELTMAVNISLI